MKELIVEAKTVNLDKIISLITSELEKYNCSMKAIMQTQIAIEELFVNICNYAYGKDNGRAKVSIDIVNNPLKAVITLTDEGIKYNPLDKDDPDINKPAGEREIGGLGILLAKKNMDNIKYKYENGKNILVLWKNIS